LGYHKQLACIILVLFVSAAAGLVWWGTDTLRQTMTQSYSQTEGVISDSYVTSTRRKRTTTYHAHVTYHYEVAGTTFTSRRFAYTHEGPEWDDKDWVEAHPPGTSVVVYYNPAAPHQSTLRSGVFWADFVVPAVMFAALFLTGGLLGWDVSKIRRSGHAGGLPTIQLSGSCWAVSLTGDAAWATAGAVGAVTVLAGTILFGISAPTSVGMLVAGQAGVVVASMLVTVSTFKLMRYLRARRKKWLVVDQAERILRIPADKKRVTDTSFAFDHIRGFGVQRTETRSGSRMYIEYQVSLAGEDSGAAFSSPVHAFDSRFEAESLASWLEERVGLRRAA
jgi:hypothetical protein